MDKFKVLLLAVTVVGVSFIAADADARGRHHHHHRHRSSVGIFFAAPAFYAPYYYYPRYYHPPAVYPAPVSPPVYIEQSVAPAPAQSSASYWYFCRDTQTYYPYVQQCATPWERVTPHSAPPS